MSIFNNIFKTKGDEVNISNLPFGSKEFGKFLDNQYQNSLDEVKMLPDTLYEDILEYDVIIDNIREMEIKKTVIEHKIKSELKEYGCGFCKDRKITWKSVTKTSLDTSRLKIELPDVVKEYSKTKTSRVFRMGR